MAAKALNRFYVYELIDPRDGKPFYVGKGCGLRHAAHVAEWRRGLVANAGKFQMIADIKAAGLAVSVRIVFQELNETEAFLKEQEHIRLLGAETLTNATRGGSNDRAKAIVQCRDLLARTIPFGRWLTRKRRSLSDIALYWHVRRELLAMAH